MDPFFDLLSFNVSMVLPSTIGPYEQPPFFTQGGNAHGFPKYA
jgi:hypothetical protein